MKAFILLSILLVTLLSTEVSTDQKIGEVDTLLEPLTVDKCERRSVGRQYYTSINSFPYYASLEYRNKTICGGVIITYVSILTAAGCRVKDIANLSVRAGSDRRETGGSIHHIRQFISHDEFRTDPRGGSDIAMIYVNEAFIFDKTRQPISIFLSGEHIKLGSVADIPSFIGTNDQLQQIAAPIVNETLCRKIDIPPGTFCAGSVGKNMCLGDRGSPVIINSRLAGIVSYGISCQTHPAVVTEVAFFRGWISNKM